MSDDTDGRSLSRRSVLQASGAALGLAGAGSARASGGGVFDFGPRCPEATREPKTVHCEGSNVAACADDHPATQRLHAQVRRALSERYPTVGALLEEGYLPYFDFLATERTGGWSHWLNPDYIGDDAFADPERPESIMVDHRWWRPLGVMFIATYEGRQVERPPPVYEEAEEDRCAPWHAHVGLPGRYSWWKYQKVFESLTAGGLWLPCRTPCMMHVWRYPNPRPGGLYAHAAPPLGQRGGPPAEEPGFETDAVPGEDELGWEVLPDAVVAELRDRLAQF
jgi:hypothetical protein